MKTQGRSFGRKAKDALLRGLMYLCAGITCALLVFLISYIFFRGIPNLSWQLISTQSSYRTNTIGILPNILNTLYIIIVSMIIVVPLGVCAAIYLTEYAKNKKVVRLISFATETLTGIPSIIFGLVGMLFFIQVLGLKPGILAGGLTLVVMVLPTIISNTTESLKTVPNSYREGALALGSGKWHMVRTVVLPNSVDGIVTVSAPQELVAMIVGKAVNLAHDLDVPVVGLVENMAYFKCDECGKEHHIFGEPQGAAVAEKYGIPAVATLPIDPKFAALCDEGKVEEYDVAGALDDIIAHVEAAKREEAEEKAE